MQSPFHADLDALNDTLVDMAKAVAAAIRSANDVLLSNDIDRAQAIISGDEDINAQQHAIDDTVIDLMTRQQPMASDLRFILGSIRIAIDLERMGDMAKHIAKIVGNAAPGCSAPEAQAVFARMADFSSQVADKTVQILLTRDRLDAAQLDLDDDEMDAMFMRLMTQLSVWQHGAEAAVDVAMIGRSYERFADHAVRIAHQIVYQVTGEVHLDR